MNQELREIKDQVIAAKKIAAFMKSPDKIFRLVGPAGSGKTTIIRKALQSLIDEDIQKGVLTNVAGICLAHKAKKVLKKSIPNTYTFAKAFGYKEKINEITGERTFEPLKNYIEEPIGHYNLPVFVYDECSMISHAMLKIILSKTSMYSKIIFMGDIIQLPPIDSSMEQDGDSPVFSMPLSEECQHTLWEPVRQTSEHPLLELAALIIEEVKNKTYDINKVNSKIFEQKMVGDIGYQLIKVETMYADYISKGNYIDNKIIAYRTNAVIKYNEEIRNVVLQYPKEVLVKGDTIFLTNNYRQKHPFEYQLDNSDEYLIIDVQENMETINGMTLSTIIGKIHHPDFGIVHVRDVPHKSRSYHEAIIEGLKESAMDNGSRWKKFYNYMDMFTTYTHAYAINAYRCQGSTYENVYLDLIDVYGVGPLTPKRMLQTIYTMITRAKKVVYFIIP